MVIYKINISKSIDFQPTNNNVLTKGSSQNDNYKQL